MKILRTSMQRAAEQQSNVSSSPMSFTVGGFLNYVKYVPARIKQTYHVHIIDPYHKFE